MSQRVLITGGAGFIGSHLARLLLEQGREVLLVDNLATGLEANVSQVLGPRCRLVVGDAGQVLQDPAIMRGVDQVYHLAASVGVRLITDDLTGMIHHNVQETLGVLQAAHQADAAVLIASSSEVYGKCPVLPLREDMELVFGPTTASRWSYGLSKAVTEHLALDMVRRAGLKAVVVRLFNTIGPRQRGRYGMVAPRFVAWAMANQPIQVYDDGQQTRSFCDVRDVVQAFPKLLAEPGCLGRVFNVGSDDPITIDALADRVLALSGSTAGKTHVPYEKVYGRDFEDPRHRRPDLTAIREAIGFAPRVPLEQTLSDLIRHAPNTGAASAAPIQDAV